MNTIPNSKPTIKYLILQDATPASKAIDKVSGRILFEKGKLMPEEVVLEIYKGSRSTGVLNYVTVDNPNFQRFIKNAGDFMRPVKKLDNDSLIKEADVRGIYNFLQIYQEKIETIINVIAKSQNQLADDIAISLEFSYINGKMVFSDIDF